jgi:hypothetical protein
MKNLNENRKNMGGGALREMVMDAYGQLERHKLVKNQYDFSSKWLRRSRGYFAYIKCSGADVNSDAALALWAECKKQKKFWRDATTQQNIGVSKTLFKGLAEKTAELEQNVGDAVMEHYLN